MSNAGERFRRDFRRRHYRIPRYDRNDIEPRGQCAHCNIWTLRKDLREQEDYRGGQVPVGLGFFVCPRCYFKPNPQGALQTLPPDPEVVELPWPNTVDFSFTPPAYAWPFLPDPSLYFVGYQISVVGLGPDAVICYADGDTWRNYDTDAVIQMETAPVIPPPDPSIDPWFPSWLAIEIEDLAAPTGFIYVRPASAGSGNGSSWANATTLASLNALIVQAATQGKHILLRADEGDHTPPVNVTITASGISRDLPVVIRGVNGDGSDGVATVRGDRAPVFAPGAAQGSPWLRLRGTKFLTLSRIRVKSWGNGALLINDDNVSDIALLDCGGENLYRCIENAGSSGGTASCRRITVQRFDGASPGGYERGFSRFQYDSADIYIADVNVDGAQQIDDSFEAGFTISTTVHNVIYRRCIAVNFQVAATTSPLLYWNGDGFSGERGNDNVVVEDCEAYDCTDGGFDFKSTNTYFRRCKAARNKKNWRVWGDAVLEDCESRDPIKRGGTGNASHINVLSTTPAIYAFAFLARDTNPAAIVYEIEGVATLFASTTNDIVTAGPLQSLELPESTITYMAPTGTVPVISSGNSFSVDELVDFTETPTANETVLYWELVGGDDRALFFIGDWYIARDGAALALPAKDFGSPSDTNLNNVYDVTLRAAGLTLNRSAPQAISVTVDDVLGNEGGDAWHVRPLAYGAANGSNWANAFGLSNIDSAVQAAAGDGRRVWVLSDPTEPHVSGAAWVSSVSITHGGTDDAHHVVIEGRDFFGNLYAPDWAAGDAQLNNPTFIGNRTAWTLPADPEQVTNVSGWTVGPNLFNLGVGANYLTFQNLGFARLGQAITRNGGNHHNVFVDLDFFNHREDIFMDASHGDVTNETIQRIKSVGCSKRVVRYRADSHDNIVQDFHMNSGRQDKDDFFTGIYHDETAHNITINGTVLGGKYDGVIMNGTDTTSAYWNSDGISAERTNYGISINRVTAHGFTDAGIDVKSTQTTITDCIVYDNKRNVRIWGVADVVLDNLTSYRPFKGRHDSNGAGSGGTGSADAIYIGQFGRVALKNSLSIHDGQIEIDDTGILWIDAATEAAFVNVTYNLVGTGQHRAMDSSNTTSPVVITSGATPNVDENTAFSETITANTDLDLLEIVGGADAALFTLSVFDLRMAKRNFEFPVDANADNIYEVTVRAYSTGVITVDQSIAVTVNDVSPELPPTPVFSTDWEGPNGATSLTDDNGLAISMAAGTTLSTTSPLNGTSSLNLTSTTSSAIVGDIAGLDVNAEYSFLTIINPTSLAATRTVASHYSSTSSQRSWLLQVLTDGSISFGYSLNGTTVVLIVSAAGVVHVGDAKEIAWDRDTGGFVRIYYDGAMVAKGATGAGAFAGSSASLRIGNTQQQLSGFIGKIDRTRMYQDYTFCGSDAGYTVAP